MILFPLIALLRLAKRPSAPDGSDVTASLLFALTLMTMLAPVDFLLRFSTSAILMEIWLGSLWVTVLLFLLDQARRERAIPPGLIQEEAQQQG